MVAKKSAREGPAKKLIQQLNPAMALACSISDGTGANTNTSSNPAPPVVLLSAAVNYLWSYNVALSAFWVIQTEGLGNLWFGMSLFLGGRLAPLPLLPTPFQDLAALLPFKWTIWFPSAALMGQMPAAQILVGLGYQLAWLAAGVVLFRILWRQALKQFTAVGT